MTNGFQCRIWETQTGRHQTDTDRDTTIVLDSPRAGGAYEITLEAQAPVRRLDDLEKARLTTWLVDQRLHGVSVPLITTQSVEVARNAPPLSVAKRADRLLQLFAKRSSRVGEQLWVAAMEASDERSELPEPLRNYWEAQAWSESPIAGEIDYLANYLSTSGWLEYPRSRDYRIIVVTVDGYSRLQSLETKVLTRQAFVAMWFHKETNHAFDQGIRPAIEEAGYAAMRIDRKEHNNKIDDEIIAEIRRSRFLVADFSHGEAGARGGVYYEAGFAHGLNISVIYTCRKADIDKLHFDTRQYNHIVWESPEELREALKNRILAVIGEGPGVSAS
ncbi:MAG: hypothetical protein F4Y35_03800 [Chloroflexi bacterium]|nr:hypothetical protein [Chloroflexota bacterium]